MDRENYDIGTPQRCVLLLGESLAWLYVVAARDCFPAVLGGHGFDLHDVPALGESFHQINRLVNKLAFGTLVERIS